MRQWLLWLGHRSRSKRFVWQTVIGIVAAGLIGAGVVRQLRPHAVQIDEMIGKALESMRFDSDESDAWMHWLTDPKTSYEDLVDGTPELASSGIIVFEQYDDQLQKRDMPADRRELLRVEFQAAADPSSAQTDQLKQWAETEPPRRYTNLARAAIFMQNGQLAPAAEAYEAEGHFADAKNSRKLAVDLYMRLSDSASLARLADDSAYATLIDAHVRVQLCAFRHQWLKIWRYIPLAMFDSYKLGPTLLAIVAGLGWFIYLLVAGETPSLISSRTGLCLLGVMMGFVAIPLTLFFIAYQQQVFGLVDSPELKKGLINCLLGIGLREELAKLLCFIPLTPILLRRRSGLEMLIVAGCVGLGFAIEENIGYFGASFGTAAAGRFITANFFHIAATALTGLAFCHMIHRPVERTGDFLVIFFGVVVAHGMYDAMQMISPLNEYAIVSIVIYVLLAYQFFHEFNRLRGRFRPPVSLTFIFAVGFAVTFAAAFDYHTYHFGMKMTAMQMVPTTLEIALIGYVFVRQVPEQWVD